MHFLRDERKTINVYVLNDSICKPVTYVRAIYNHKNISILTNATYYHSKIKQFLEFGFKQIHQLRCCDKTYMNNFIKKTLFPQLCILYKPFFDLATIFENIK